MAVHLVFAKAIIPIVTRFFDPLPVTISSDPLAVTNLVPKISGMDHDTFTLVKAEILTFQDPFWFSVEIQLFSLTSLSHFSFAYLASSGILSTSIIFMLSN